MTYEEYETHVKAGRSDCAANCQREAVYAHGVVECPEWAAPAIPEVGFTDSELDAVKADFAALTRLVRSERHGTGNHFTSHDRERRAVVARLLAMVR